MFNEVVTDTNIVYYLMIAIGAVGVLAKAVNQITLRRLVRAAGSMSKSTHKLIKLVRAKYDHALMLHDRVENAEAFVEKYIYEYRGFLLRIHTWRQLELQSIWFSGILAAFGGVIWYMENGFCEEMYRYISLGAAEMVLLFVVSQLSDEQYKIEAAKNYMVDYLENVCAQRRRKTRQSEKDQINVIQPEAAQNFRTNGREAEESKSFRAGGRETEETIPFRTGGREAEEPKSFRAGGKEAEEATAFRANGREAEETKAFRAGGRELEEAGIPGERDTAAAGSAVKGRRASATGRPALGRGMAQGKQAAESMDSQEDAGLSISIEGEPRRPVTGVSGDTSPMYSSAEELAAVAGLYEEEMERIPGAAAGYGTAAAVQTEAAAEYGGSASVSNGHPVGAGRTPAYGHPAGKGVSASGRAENGTQMRRIPGRFQDIVQRMIEDTTEYEEVLEGPALPEQESHPAGRTASHRTNTARQVLRRTVKGNPESSEREESAMKEEAIRQILEEFLA